MRRRDVRRRTRHRRGSGAVVATAARRSRVARVHGRRLRPRWQSAPGRSRPRRRPRSHHVDLRGRAGLRSGSARAPSRQARLQGRLRRAPGHARSIPPMAAAHSPRASIAAATARGRATHDALIAHRADLRRECLPSRRSRALSLTGRASRANETPSRRKAPAGAANIPRGMSGRPDTHRSPARERVPGRARQRAGACSSRRKAPAGAGNIPRGMSGRPDTHRSPARERGGACTTAGPREVGLGARIPRAGTTGALTRRLAADYSILYSLPAESVSFKSYRPPGNPRASGRRAFHFVVAARRLPVVSLDPSQIGSAPSGSSSIHGASAWCW